MALWHPRFFCQVSEAFHAHVQIRFVVSENTEHSHIGCKHCTESRIPAKESYAAKILLPPSMTTDLAVGHGTGPPNP